MFLLNSDAFCHLDLELVVINDFSSQLDGELVLGGCLKESGNVVGDAHQIDRRRAFVFEFHRCCQLLSTV